MLHSLCPVSYTHLDVYKRQVKSRTIYTQFTLIIKQPSYSSFVSSCFQVDEICDLKRLAVLQKKSTERKKEKYMDHVSEEERE